MAAPNKVILPLHGKMGMRTFHRPNFWQAMGAARLELFYLVDPAYFEILPLDAARYGRLAVDDADGLLRKNVALSEMVQLRRFFVRTETTDLRIRETVEAKLFENAAFASVWMNAAMMDILRHIPGAGRAAIGLERLLAQTDFYGQCLRDPAVASILVPGLGNWGFWNELVVAREAQRLGIPTIAAITNYDNLVNRGFRGFMPERLAVWSKIMADEAIRLQGVPAGRIEITGPPQYDSYFVEPSVTREQFLRSKGLDPAKPTILYAGGVNMRRYFEMLDILEAYLAGKSRASYNVILRIYPNPKVLGTPEWKYFERVVTAREGIYVSNSLETSSDSLTLANVKSEFDTKEEWDELSCLLRFSDVMLNHYSTMALEAAICDLPVIQVGYDASTYGHKYNNTAAYQRRQTHNLRECRLAAAKTAVSREDLVKHLDAYLADKALDRDKRHEYALAECTYLDGRSSERLVQLLKAVDR